MIPDEYESWYASMRGRWIGEIALRLLKKYLDYHSGDQVLDVGCGTGWFTRRIAQSPESKMTGIDTDFCPFKRYENYICSG